MKWHSLVVLNLVNNNITSSLPTSIGPLNLLKFLHLYNNKFCGKLPSLKSCKELVILDVGENEFAECILSWIGCRCLSWMVLSLRSNNFHGHILEELCPLTSLQILDLSHNKLSRRIPRCVKNFNVMSTNNNSHHHKKVEPLEYFYGASLPLESALLVIKESILEYSTILQLVKSVDFSHNNLSREIPEEVTNLRELQSLNLSYNLLIGSIPENIGKMESMEFMDFSMNQLLSQIPSSMSSLTFLNHLNLSHNNLIGKIPLGTQLQSFSASSFMGNKLEYSTILQLVKSVDFSHNNLSREIPKEVTNLPGLQSLNLSYNLLIGSILENIGKMESMESMNFSMNQLSSQIPSNMSSLTFLKHLNLSHNNLIGKIPSSTQLQSFSASSFMGNKLCGPPLIDTCTADGVKPKNENHKSIDSDRLKVDWFYVSMTLGFMVGFWDICGSFLLNKHWRIIYFQLLDHMLHGTCLGDIVSL